MFDLINFDIQKQRHSELLKEAANYRLITQIKQSGKAKRAGHAGNHFWKSIFTLLFHKRKEHGRSILHHPHSLKV